MYFEELFCVCTLMIDRQTAKILKKNIIRGKNSKKNKEVFDFDLKCMKYIDKIILSII